MIQDTNKGLQFRFGKVRDNLDARALMDKALKLVTAHEELSKNQVNAMRKSLMDDYVRFTNGLDFLRTKQEILVVTNMNLMGAIAKTDQSSAVRTKLIKVASLLGLPFSPEGMVVRKGEVDPCFQGGISEGMGVSLRLFPSVQHSVLTLKSKSIIFNVDSKSVFKELLESYRPERGFAVLNDFSRMEFTKLGKVNLSHYEVWMSDVDFFGASKVYASLLERSRLYDFVRDLIGGDNPDEAFQKSLNKIMQSEDSLNTIRFICNLYLKGNAVGFTNTMMTIMQQKRVTSEMPITLEGMTRKIHSSMLVEYDADPFTDPAVMVPMKMLPALLGQCLVISPEKIKPAMLSAMIRTTLYTGPHLAKELISLWPDGKWTKQCASKWADDLHGPLGLPDLLGRASNKERRKTLEDVLGL